MLPNYGPVIKKKFTRSGQPDKEGFKKLRTRGVQMVVKLTTNEEYPDKKEYKQFGSEVTFQDMSPFSSPEQSLQAQRIARMINTLLNEGKWVHVHCHLGRDRTGLVVGMWMLKYGGYTLAQVQAAWKRYGAPFIAYQRMLEAVACEWGKGKSKSC